MLNPANYYRMFDEDKTSLIKQVYSRISRSAKQFYRDYQDAQAYYELHQDEFREELLSRDSTFNNSQRL